MAPTVTTTNTSSSSNGTTCHNTNTAPCSTNPNIARGIIVVVAKCPIPGKSKTRLIPLLGPEGSVVLAKAMLSDVLTTLSECEELAQVDKILLYAPPTDQGASIMEALLQELGLSMSSSSSSSSSSVNQPPQQKQHQRMWTLRPMMAADNLLASHLGSQLTQALIETRKQYPSFYPSEQQQQQQQQKSSVIFLGMDSPELPLDEIVAALSSTNELHHHYAHLCPAADGGYGMLSIPAHAPADLVFRGVKWSDPLTAVSQIKALTDIDSVSVRLGRCMHDIDEKQDVKALCERLRLRQGEEAVVEVPATMPTDAFETPNDTNDGDIADCLQVQSASAAAVTGGRPQTGSCRFTRKALMQLGQL